MTKGTTKNDTTETSELPNIHLPGDEKFQSYKTALQDYCFKKKFPAPLYLTEKEGDALIGTVSFSCSYVKCEQTSSSMKEADSRAAYEALTQLGYLKEHKFEFVRKQLKRKDGGDNNMENNPKHVKPGTISPVSSKSHLIQIAQRKQLGNPVYNSVAVDGGYSSTVTVGDNQFKSTSVHKKQKDAEHDASDLALCAIVPTLAPGKTPDKTPGKTPKTPIPPFKGFKSHLQEYCQKASKALPVYDMKHNEEDKTYQATVTVDGIQYFGLAQKGKKSAEVGAAEGALKALGLFV